MLQTARDARRHSFSDVSACARQLRVVPGRLRQRDAARGRFLRLGIGRRAIDDTLGDALHNAAIQNAINETYAPVVAAVAKLLDACVADGSVCEGFDPADILLLMGFLWRVGPGAGGVERGRRLMQMALDGIRRTSGR